MMCLFFKSLFFMLFSPRCCRKMRKKRTQNLIVRNHIFRVDRICIKLVRWFFPSLLIVLCIYTTSFYDVAFIELKYEETHKKVKEITIIIHPLRCRFPSKKKNSELRSASKVSNHPKYLCCANIFSSKWECWRYLYDIKMQLLRGRIMHRSLLPYFSVRQSSN